MHAPSPACRRGGSGAQGRRCRQLLRPPEENGNAGRMRERGRVPSAAVPPPGPRTLCRRVGFGRRGPVRSGSPGVYWVAERPAKPSVGRAPRAPEPARRAAAPKGTAFLCRLPLISTQGHRALPATDTRRLRNPGKIASEIRFLDAAPPPRRRTEADRRRPPDGNSDRGGGCAILTVAATSPRENGRGRVERVPHDLERL